MISQFDSFLSPLGMYEFSNTLLQNRLILSKEFSDNTNLSSKNILKLPLKKIASFRHTIREEKNLHGNRLTTAFRS